MRQARPVWFTVASGTNVGRRHLAGWSHTAIGDVEIGICPRCHALVITDSTAYGDRSWAHEQWHAATDYPDPDND